MAKAKSKKRSVVRLIRKSNDLVEAKYKFDIWEMRIFTKMLTLIHPDDKDFKDYRIYLHEVINDFELKKNKEAYEWLKRGARKLMTKIIRVVRETDEGPMEFQTPITVGVENPLNQTKSGEMAYVDVSFHPKMKPYLIALQSKFTIYDVRNILNLPSSYSIRIYELLKQYEKIGRRKIALTELKEIIGVIEEVEEKGKKLVLDNYPLYGNFRQRVLLKAQKDLKKYTDISFEFEPVKRGRKVDSLVFFIISNKQTKEEKKTNKSTKIPVEIIESELFNELFPRVEKWIKKSAFRNLLKKYPEAQVKNAVELTLNRIKRGDNIINVAGHIVQLAKQTTLFDSGSQKKQEAIEKKKKAADLGRQKESLKKLKKELETERYQKELLVIDAIVEEFPEAREIALLKVTSGMFGKYYDSDKSFDENCENQLFLTAFRGAVKKEFPSKFLEINKEYNPKILKVKQRIERL